MTKTKKVVLWCSGWLGLKVVSLAVAVLELGLFNVELSAVVINEEDPHASDIEQVGMKSGAVVYVDGDDIAITADIGLCIGIQPKPIQTLAQQFRYGIFSIAQLV